MLGELRVEDALVARRQIMDDVASDPESAIWLLEEAKQDPYYSEALTAYELLSSLHMGIVNRLERLGEQKTEEKVPTDQQESPSEINWEHILNEAVDVDQEAFKKQKDIIINAHHIIEDLSHSTNGKSKLADKKLVRQQRQALHRALGEYWAPEEFIDDPELTKTILESWMTTSSVPESKRQIYIGLFTESISKYIRNHQADLTPESIASFIASVEKASIAQELMTDTYIKSYFESVTGNDPQSVSDNYYKFVRSLLRLSDNPAALIRGLKIAIFETDTLPMEGRYHKMWSVGAQTRYDLTDMQIRTMSANMTILELCQRYLKRGPNENFHLKIDLEDVFSDNEFERLSGLPIETRQQYVKENAKRIRGRLDDVQTIYIQQVNIAIAKIGIDEYTRRHRVGGLIHETLPSEEMYKTVLEDLISGTNAYQGHVDAVYHYLAERYPEDTDLLEALLLSSDVLMEEFRVTYPAMSLDTKQSMKAIKDFPDLEKTIHRAFADITQSEITLDEQLLPGPRERIPLGDGFIMEVHDIEEGFDAYDVDTEEVDMKLNEACEAVSKLKGKVRPFSIFSVEDNNGKHMDGIIRKETALDKGELHPLNEFSSSDLPHEYQLEESEDDIDQRINHLFNRYLTDRRRFMNKRGLMVVWETTDVGEVQLEIHKHPKDPQIYVCKWRNQDKSAIFLIDREFRIQLGKKKATDSKFLKQLNLLAANVLTGYFTQQAVESEEGTIEEGRAGVTERIAHLHLLPNGQKYSYEAWGNCLEEQGLDLEVLSKLQQIKRKTSRQSTYYKALIADEEDKGPLRIKPLKHW
ncbi:MAG TPA: hypothetical protein VMR08_00920 [Patescibacteria group bacterium]|nr:hypothetical protein [Patescibacteria group bacterium]